MNERAATGLAYAATDGAAYDIFLGRWTERLSQPFLDFIDPPDGALLDVGCGTGSLARAMKHRWPERRVCGIDVSDAYVAFACGQADAEIDYRVADAMKLPQASNTFAAAAAQLVLNFVPDPRVALREMMRVTRSGGVVAASVWDFRGGLVFQRMFWDTAAGIDPGAGQVRDKLFSGALALPDGLEKLFDESGLERVRRGSLTIRMDYASFDDYWEPLLGGQGPVGTYAAGLDPDLRRQVKASVRAAFLSGAPDGPRSLTATAWAVRGRVPQRR
ncbi:MAG: class I SAM-dependent methyltransferase [Xanthobacteraceae bacterium]|nr:class I SAM-dependent methyltransferase [Xanthobacteraceae bacterium]